MLHHRYILAVRSLISSEMDGTSLPSIPKLSLHSGLDREKINVEQIVDAWLSKLQDVFTRRSFDNLSDLFIEDCWWRDILGLTWDFRSRQGQANISKYLHNAASPLENIQAIKLGGLKPIFLDIAGMIWIQSGFTFKTQHGEGRGVVRLANVDELTWKAWIVFTQLDNLDFQKDLQIQKNRNPAAAARLSPPPSTNGLTNSNKEDLQVLIVGAGKLVTDSTLHTNTRHRTSRTCSRCSFRKLGHPNIASRQTPSARRLLENAIRDSHPKHTDLHRPLPFREAPRKLAEMAFQRSGRRLHGTLRATHGP